jgi:DtxR family Mn-dependent transcriptional regulator
MRGEAVEDYLKGIYELSRPGGEGSAVTLSRVTTQELSERVGVSAASASRMLKNLDRLGLVTHDPYRGATLTEQGEKAALEVIRHHRLIELFLHEKLGYGWDEVHDEAERLEHYISEELEARISDALGSPAVDPHGDVIPTAEGSLPPEQEESLARQLPLSDAPRHERLILRRVPSADPEKLRYLRDIGLVPGAWLEVLERYPFGGGLRIRTERGGETVVGEDLAGQIRVSGL